MDEIYCNKSTWEAIFTPANFFQKYKYGSMQRFKNFLHHSYSNSINGYLRKQNIFTLACSRKVCFAMIPGGGQAVSTRQYAGWYRGGVPSEFDEIT